MAKPRRAKAVLAPAARLDILEILQWTERTFGSNAMARYEALLSQALCDIASDPERPESRERPELGLGVRSYHLRFSRNRARTTLGVVHNPRHFVIYRRSDPVAVVDVLRILHDGRDLTRYLPRDE